MSADQLFHQQDRRDERAEEQRALYEMPGLLSLFEAIDFVHAVLGRNYIPYRGMMISTTRMPHPLEFVYVVQIWHCENGFLQYANGFGESHFDAYDKAIAYIAKQKADRSQDMP